MEKLPKLIENLPDSRLLEIQNNLLKKRSLLRMKSVSKAKMSKKSYYSGLNYLLYSNIEHNTLYSHTNKLQCDEGRSRSQGDLYMMMRHYYPGITFKEFRVALFRLLNDRKVNTFFCNNINKRIFFKCESSLTAEDDPNISSLLEPDEFNSTFAFEDGISRDDIYDLEDSNNFNNDDGYFNNVSWSEDY